MLTPLLPPHHPQGAMSSWHQPLVTSLLLHHWSGRWCIGQVSSQGLLQGIPWIRTKQRACIPLHVCVCMCMHASMLCVHACVLCIIINLWWLASRNHFLVAHEWKAREEKGKFDQTILHCDTLEETKSHLVLISGVEGNLTDLAVLHPVFINGAHFQLEALEQGWLWCISIAQSSLHEGGRKEKKWSSHQGIVCTESTHIQYRNIANSIVILYTYQLPSSQICCEAHPLKRSPKQPINHHKYYHVMHTSQLFRWREKTKLWICNHYVTTWPIPEVEIVCL